MDMVGLMVETEVAHSVLDGDFQYTNVVHESLSGIIKELKEKTESARKEIITTLFTREN